MTDQYAVIGNPIAQSKSPLIHTEFARGVNHDISYERILAPLDKFHGTIDEFRQRGARGANVTMPFKFEAYEYATKLTDRAKASGAANTLRFDGKEIFGDNTDGVGLTRDITENLGVPITGARVLLLGAGGAAYGVFGALLEQHPSTLAIANRTYEKAAKLAAKYSGSVARAITFADLPSQQFDIIINATAASLSDELPLISPSNFAPNSLAYDMMYGKGDTAFLQLAKRADARAVDGVGMLAEQAAEAFFVWRGVRVKTAGVIAMLSQA
jgi:shikimate dehydrogenase